MIDLANLRNYRYEYQKNIYVFDSPFIEEGY